MYEIHLVGGWLSGYHLQLVSSSNGQILMHSEKYYTKSNARRAARKLAKNLDLPYKEL